MSQVIGKDLKDIIEYAYTNVPLYMNRIINNKIPDSIEDVPILRKNELNNDLNSCISNEYVMAMRNNKLMKVRTSGTTGITSEVFWDNKDNNRSLLSLWLLRKRFYNILPSDKLVYFYPCDYRTDGSEVIDEYSLGISKRFLIDGNIEEKYKRILEYDPVWMITQPSVALLLCDAYEKVGIKIKSLRYIELTGEYLHKEARERIEKVFDCIVANQYGTKEVNSIAFECPCGKMHIMEDNVYVECEKVDENEDFGNIIVTSRINKAMPILRYFTGDVGKINNIEKCDCGLSSKELILRQGRDDDQILFPDGTRKNAYILFQVLNHINYVREGVILQYQIIQKGFMDFIVYIVVNEEYNEDISYDIIFEFKKRLWRDVNINIYIVDDFLKAYKKEKLACFICEEEN